MLTTTSHFIQYLYRLLFTKMFLCRAWQRKLHNLVSKDEHRAEMYACLWMLIAEQDKHKFQELQELFVNYWEAKETQFIAYISIHSFTNQHIHIVNTHFSILVNAYFYVNTVSTIN